jgi:hypothetical protein
MRYIQHHMIYTTIKPNIDAADICERLVGITPIYLQNFISRGLYGLRASAKPGKIYTLRRLFSRDDVFGIALVWLLFESGLRSEPLLRILNEIAGTKKANANLAAKKLLESGAEYLVITRQPRGPTKVPEDKPGQNVGAIRQGEFAKTIEQHQEQGIVTLLVIPVGMKFADVQKRVEILY